MVMVRERSVKVGEKGETSAAEKKEEKKRKPFKTLSLSTWERVILLAKCKKRGAESGTYKDTKTPVVSWLEGAHHHQNGAIIKGKGKETTFRPPALLSLSSPNLNFSARKLGAALWELNMYLGVNSSSNSNNHRGRRHRLLLTKDEDIDHHHHHHHDYQHVDPHRGASPDRHHPASASSLRRQIAASLMRHHQSTERNKQALQPLSPASYGSSLEMAPYNPAATPDSSIELRGRVGESSYSFKTSTELLKVLNRIWTLEEQHASNISLVKALKIELDHARARIKDLLRGQQASRHEIDDLMKQISDDSVARKGKEQERIDVALQSVRDELEDERKLRKRSESLHRKLARELFEVKVALSSTVKEMEKERKSSELLEELCDEFAKSIREFARQLHTVKEKSDEDWTDTTEQDNLILHISESWLDERLQMRETNDRQRAPRSSVVDKLKHEIEAFLSARHIRGAKDTVSHRDPKEARLRRRSLESIPEAVSGAQFAETIKAGNSNYEEQEEIALSVRRKGQSPPSVHMSDPQNTPREIDANILKANEETPTEISMLQKSDLYDSIADTTYQRRKTFIEEGHGSNSKTVDKLISELILSEGGSFPPEYEYTKEVTSNGNPALRRHASPIRQWAMNMASPDTRFSESSSKKQPTRESTLKAKLQEPKVKGQRSRLKILKGSS